MNCRVYSILILMVIMSCLLSSSALAVTIDLFSLMNNNSNTSPLYNSNGQIIYLGDSGGNASFTDYSSSAIETFSLPQEPVLGGNFSITIDFGFTEYDNFFTINGSPEFHLSVTGSSQNNQTTNVFTGSNDLLNFGTDNTLSFNLAISGSNYEDMLIYDFYLTYEEVEQQSNAPVPEPSTWLLLSSGLAGLVIYGRKRKKA